MANAAWVWGAGMCQYYATEVRQVGWMVPVGIQLIPVVAIAIAGPLLSSRLDGFSHTASKPDQALRALKKLRRKIDVAAGSCEAEMEALIYAIEFERTYAPLDGGIWLGAAYKQLIHTNLFFFFYRSTGNQCFLQRIRYYFFQVYWSRKQSIYLFDPLPAHGTDGGLTGLFLTDQVGRRPLLIIGSAPLVLFDGLAAGLERPPDQERAAGCRCLLDIDALVRKAFLGYPRIQ